CTDEVTVDVVLFFFSSRRRHTRFSRDWSSDVCSSDLIEKVSVIVGTEGKLGQRMVFDKVGGAWGVEVNSINNLIDNLVQPIRDRSEERRVGKECRARWSQHR